MSDDPIARIAKQRFISASAEIEAQLTVIQGARPVLVVLLFARDEAAAALAELALADGANLRHIRDLQNTVRRYDDIVRWFARIVSLGIEYDKEITSDDRDEMLEILARTPEGQQEAVDLGLIEVETNDA